MLLSCTRLSSAAELRLVEYRDFASGDTPSIDDPICGKLAPPTTDDPPFTTVQSETLGYPVVGSTPVIHSITVAASSDAIGNKPDKCTVDRGEVAASWSEESDCKSRFSITTSAYSSYVALYSKAFKVRILPGKPEATATTDSECEFDVKINLSFDAQSSSCQLARAVGIVQVTKDGTFALEKLTADIKIDRCLPQNNKGCPGNQCEVTFKLKAAQSFYIGCRIFSLGGNDFNAPPARHRASMGVTGTVSIEKACPGPFTPITSARGLTLALAAHNGQQVPQAELLSWLEPNLKTAVEKFRDLVTAEPGNQTFTITSSSRPIDYQRHLREVRDKLNELACVCGMVRENTALSDNRFRPRLVVTPGTPSESCKRGI